MVYFILSDKHTQIMNLSLNLSISSWFSELEKETSLTEMQRLGVEEELHFLQNDLNDFISSFHFAWKDDDANKPWIVVSKVHSDESGADFIHEDSSALIAELSLRFKETQPSFSLQDLIPGMNEKSIPHFEQSIISALIEEQVSLKNMQQLILAEFSKVDTPKYAPLFSQSGVTIHPSIEDYTNHHAHIDRAIFVIGSPTPSPTRLISDSNPHVGRSDITQLIEYLKDHDAREIMLDPRHEKPYQMLNDDQWRRKSKRQKFNKS